MADKRGWREKVRAGEPAVVSVGWGTGETAEVVDELPWKRPSWKPAEKVRAVDTSPLHVGGEEASRALTVHMEHRDWPGVRFTVSLDDSLALSGVEVGPLRWRIIRESPTFTGAEVTTTPSPGLALTASALRGINWGELHRVAQVAARQNWGWVAPKGSTLAMSFDKGPRRPGRRGHGDPHYAALAARYVSLVASGDPRPIATMAAEMNESSKYVREAISRCRTRQRPMLTAPPRRGVPGGDLTPAALAVLSEGDET